MRRLARYKNGNVITTIYDDGTKTHFTMDDEFKFEFPESHDISISQCCDNGCKWCYYGCTRDGKHGKLNGWKFFETMRPYTEIAINLQSPLPSDITSFLMEMHERNIIVNATINQNHFMDSDMQSFISYCVSNDLIKGVGVSLTNPREDGFIETVKKYPNAVIHIIAGITPIEDIMVLMGNDLKILILGYKTVGRGDDFFYYNAPSIVQKISDIRNNIDEMLNRFKVVSFDNLAIEQLNVKDMLTDEEWNEFYGGDDGTVTFFIDLVKGVFARNSLSRIVYTIGDKSIDEMFEIIKQEVGSE